ncbi:MAG: hypothetical protein J6B16_05060 [Clostridia bacterium]|nr:hypothetical protein [Clostridia bacterium]
MPYQKQVLSVKEVSLGYAVSGKVSGVATLELDNGVLTATVDLANLNNLTDGEFLFLLHLDKYLFKGSVGDSIINFKATFNVETDVLLKANVVLLHAKRQNGQPPIIVAFANGLKDCNVNFYIQKVINDDSYYAQNTEKISPMGEVSLTANETAVLDDNLKNTDPVTGDMPYNDEQIATDNYYEIAVSEIENDIKEDVYAEKRIIDDENVVFKENDSEKREEKSVDFNVFQDEAILRAVKGDYYDKIKPDLDKIFSTCRQNYSLTNSLVNSVFYDYVDENQNTVAVGVIKDGDTVKYLCYGIPAKYSLKAPNELSSYATFIPVSIYEMAGDGYWVIFQDAKTGKCIKSDSL